MKSIAVTKPDMGVLPRERLLLSPFGTLAQAFAEELLARARQEEGAWPHVPLELLEEGAAPDSAAPANVTLQVDLRLALEALRREGERTEQRQAAERIVERALQLQARREPPRQTREGPAAPAVPGPMTVLNTVRQKFQQNLTQNIHITQSLSGESDLRDRQVPGGLARQAEAFSRRLRTLREEGAAPPRQTGRDGGDGFQLHTGTGSDASEWTAPQPREALDLLNEQGAPEDRAARSAAEALDREGRRLLGRLTESLEDAAKAAPELRQSREAASARRESAAGKEKGPEETPARIAPTGPAAPAEEIRAGGRTLSTAARDIRMSPVDRPGREEPLAQTEAGTAEERAQIPARPPVELSHRTEPAAEETGPRDPGARTRREQPGADRRGGEEVTRSAGEKPRSGAPAGQSPEREHGRTGSDGRRESSRRAGYGPAQEQGSTDAAEPAGPRTGAGRMPTQARDIRVSPAGRAQGGETAGRPEDAVPRQERAAFRPEAENDGPVQPPVELTHRTEPETGEELSRDRRTETDRKRPERRTRRESAEKQEDRSRAGRSPEQARPEAGESLPRTGAGQMLTQARDIRVGSEGRTEDGATALSEQQRAALGAEARTRGPAQPPVELTHRTEPETGEELSRERRSETDRGQSERRSRQERTERQTDRSRAGRRPEQERTEAGESSLRTGAGRMPTQARDIRVGPEGRPGREETAGRPETAASQQQRAPFGPEARSDGSVRPPVELTYRAEPETDIQAAATPQTAAGNGPITQQHSDRPLPPVRTAARAPRTGEGPAAGCGLYTAARDIRTGAGRRLGGIPETGALRETAGDLPVGSASSDTLEAADLEHLTRAAEQSLPPQELALHLPATDGDGPAPEGQALQTGAGDRSDRESARPEPLPLTYGPVQPASAQQPERPGGPQTGESDYVRSLPDWAKRFLREGAPETPGSRTMGVARDIASLPQTEPKDIVQWTAPEYHPPEAPTTYREKERPRPREGGEVQISDAEIRRTADKVYRMIEERLRRERRRLGF